MGKSYRKPYSAITGVRSAAYDKMVARRCWRRAQNQTLRECIDYEELVMPKRLEAPFNNVYSWNRDGKQTLQFPPKPHVEGIWNGYKITGPHSFRWRNLEWYERIQKK
jgi:hypothetical protein